MVKVGVIGAGVNGIACAIKIKEKYPQCDVVVLAEKLSPDTTGDGSGGLWYPYCCQNTPQHLLNKWGSETYKFLLAVSRLEDDFKVCTMPVYALYREPAATETPEWAGSVFSYHALGEKQLKSLSRLYSVEYVAGHTFTTFVVHTSSLLSYLYGRFARAGGSVTRRTVTSLRDAALASFDVVVNCSGLGARDLVPDENVYPIRGQVIRVEAPWPWLNYALLDMTSGNYIIPNAETCVLGGTQQANNFNTTICPEDSEFILNGCCTLIPALKNTVQHQQSTDETVLDGEVVLRGDTQAEHMYDRHVDSESAIAQSPERQDAQAWHFDPPPRPPTPTSPSIALPQPQASISTPLLESRTSGSRVSQRNLAQQRRAENRRRIIQQHRQTSQNRAATDANADEPAARQPETTRPPSRRRGDVDSVADAILEELRRNPEDENTHFGLAIGQILRSLRPNVASELRVKILGLIHEAQYGDRINID